MGAPDTIQAPIGDELQWPVHAIALRRAAKGPYRARENSGPLVDISQIWVFQNLGNVIMNEQVGKGPAKNHISGKE